MPDTSKPWLKIPSVSDTHANPNELARRITEATGRVVKVWEFEQFRGLLIGSLGKTSPDLLHYGMLTNLFPRGLDSVLDGSERLARTGRPLMLIVRTFEGCLHALSALYEQHPVIESPWNCALLDHANLWTWTRCEICATAELARTTGVQ